MKNSDRLVLVMLACCGAANRAPAQMGTGSFVWQASIDEGSSWCDHRIDLAQSQQSVLVRAVVGWSLDAGYAFGFSAFDIAITTPGQDLAKEFAYSHPFSKYTGAGVLASTRFGDTIKIDHYLDQLPPGQGTRSLIPQQLPEYFGDFFTSANPVEIFRFRLTLDGTAGERRVHEFFRSFGGSSNTTDRVFRTWTSFGGDLNYPSTVRQNLLINVLPECAADFNGDLHADFFDYLDFVTAFDDEDPSADFDGSGQVDFFDYLDFVSAFDTGCE